MQMLLICGFSASQSHFCWRLDMVVFLTSDKLIISGWRLTYPSEKYESQLGI